MPAGSPTTGDFLRADIGSRSVVLVRENAECVHAMRNACLHAGYRVCEEESGRTDQLFCQYHGWYYAFDGKLTEPMLQPKMTDRSRFRLPRYAMQIQRGLILVDLSKVAPDPPPAGPIELGDIPEDLGERAVSRRHAGTRRRTTGSRCGSSYGRRRGWPSARRVSTPRSNSAR